MYGKMKQHLRAELDSLGEAGLYKRERVIVSPQRAAIGVAGGKEVINFCANNYLGLSDHPRLIEAAKRAIGATLPSIEKTPSVTITRNRWA